MTKKQVGAAIGIIIGLLALAIFIPAWSYAGTLMCKDSYDRIISYDEQLADNHWRDFKDRLKEGYLDIACLARSIKSIFAKKVYNEGWVTKFEDLPNCPAEIETTLPPPKFFVPDSKPVIKSFKSKNI